MSGTDFRVPPRSWDNIAQVTETLRGQFGLTHEPNFPVMDFVERVLDHKLGWLTFLVGDDDEMEGAEGLTPPDGSYIMIRDDVYAAAGKREGRARFTVAHELGHWILHTNVPFARVSADVRVKPYRLSEPQANQFAAELLMPRDFFTPADSVEEVVRRHGVSHEAAEWRLKFLKDRGLI